MFSNLLLINAESNDVVYYSTKEIAPINLDILDGSSGGGVTVAEIRISFNGDKAYAKFVPKNGYSQGRFTGDITSVTYGGTCYDRESFILATTIYVYKPARGHITISGTYYVGTLKADIGKVYVY